MGLYPPTCCKRLKVGSFYILGAQSIWLVLHFFLYDSSFDVEVVPELVTHKCTISSPASALHVICMSDQTGNTESKSV